MTGEKETVKITVVEKEPTPLKDGEINIEPSNDIDGYTPKYENKNIEDFKKKQKKIRKKVQKKEEVKIEENKEEIRPKETPEVKEIRQEEPKKVSEPEKVEIPKKEVKEEQKEKQVEYTKIPDPSMGLLSEFMDPIPKNDIKLNLFGMIWTTLSRWVSGKTIAFLSGRKKQKKKQKEKNTKLEELEIYKELYAEQGIQIDIDEYKEKNDDNDDDECIYDLDEEIIYSEDDLQRVKVVMGAVNKL